MNPFLEVQNLCVHFPIRSGFLRQISSYVHAVDQVSFKLERGKSLGLVGESGSGKSSLGLALMGLNPVHAGKILLEGKEIQRASYQNLRKKLQIVFQDSSHSLNPKRTIAEHLADPLRRYKIVAESDIAQESAELLTKVGLDPEMLERYPHAFSGGQRQRLNIARALACRPEFLMCDEVTSALDVRTQAQVLDLLKTLKQELQLTTLFISHDLAVVQDLCDEVMVMQRGQMVESGQTSSIFHNPQNPYTQELIRAVPRIG